MAETHVVSALKEKRIKLATEIEGLQSQLRQRVIDLDHCEATLRLFDPDADFAALGPRKVPQVLTDIHGDTGRVILDTLRTATAPVSTAKVCEAVMRARGLDTDDKGLCRLMMKRTVANLKHWSKKRGLVRSLPGVGQQLAWELVR
ncbi:MAG TPA: hypothetical protein VII56_21960 [Rhizomicrobium sp.]